MYTNVYVCIYILSINIYIYIYVQPTILTSGPWGHCQTQPGDHCEHAQSFGSDQENFGSKFQFIWFGFRTLSEQKSEAPHDLPGPNGFV